MKMAKKKSEGADAQVRQDAQKIVMVNVCDIRPYGNNPRNNDNAVDKVAESIRLFGFKVPVIIDADNVIVCCHTRLKAAMKLGMTEVPCISAADLTPEQVKGLRIIDNKTHEFSEWDTDKLAQELEALQSEFPELDAAFFGFGDLEAELGSSVNGDYAEEGSLARDFIAPPFSVLDSRQFYWQNRKRAWLGLPIRSELGRTANLIFAKNLKMGEKDNGTSVFDPVLCEICCRWFCPPGGDILDPFAGGSVRGIVAAKLGMRYVGIDLRKEQVDANVQNAKEALKDTEDNLFPSWVNGDSSEILADDGGHIIGQQFDLVFTCPPYFDLERYSDDGRDISNMGFAGFSDVYAKILKLAFGKLKAGGFFIVVISNVRDERGFYRDLTGLTKEAARESGAGLYNEIIFLNAVGTSALRARITARKRKVTRTHQEVLVFKKKSKRMERAHDEVMVFYKGDPRGIESGFPKDGDKVKGVDDAE